jgi:alpha-1,3-glucan synthase
MSVFWWIGFRMFKSLYVLTVPFAVYGLAFFILSLSPFVGDIHTRGWVQDVATGFYAAASSSGSFFFALNFGSEGMSTPDQRLSASSLISNSPLSRERACCYMAIPSLGHTRYDHISLARLKVIAIPLTTFIGTQQAYIVMLWFWGARLTKAVAPTVASTGVVSYGATNTIIYTSIVIPLAILLWAIGMTLFLGLPSYYRQAPGHVPSFYKSITSRNIILWFFVAVLVQNFFLSAPYGRNWKYLWSSQHAPQWAIGLLVALFFGLIWAALLYLFSRLSRSHSWILPIFAVGLGAPRWCQMLWGTSGMGLYFPLPLANSLVAGALAGRSLWLWLGVLDALQGVGFGMILLQTMTRFHVTFTLVFAQALGGLATIVARAVAPDRDGPGPVFPNLTISMAGFGNAWFWVAVVCQVGLCVGFFKFFRKEQLQKP